MALGLIWVPNNLGDNRMGYTCYSIETTRMEDYIKYIMDIKHKANDYHLLERWKNICRNIDIYIMIFYNGEFQYYLFKNTLPNELQEGNSTRRLTMTCSNCNVERIPVLPSFINLAKDQGIIIGSYSQKGYW